MTAIDVSSYQGVIEWQKAYGQGGVRRAYIKWGEYWRSTGTWQVDQYALRNINEARAAGVEIGLYFFAHPSNSPMQEARWFLRTALPHIAPGDLPPALDLEVTEAHDWAFLTEWKALWFQAVDPEVGCRACFYSYLSFWQKMVLLPERPIWGALTGNPRFTPPPSWWLWQHSFTGRCAGIGGAVDLDRVLWEPKRVGSGLT